MKKIQDVNTVIRARKQRFDFTALERMNNAIWSFKRILKIRFKNRKALLIATLLFIFPLFFIINNYIKYSPNWGYDGKLHIDMIISLAKYGKFLSGSAYSSTQPPFYYLVSAVVYKIFENMKIVQFASVATFILMVYLFYKSLILYTKKGWFSYFFIILFIFLPVSINYAYMVYNYPLGHLFSVLAFFILIYAINKRKFTLKYLFYLSLATSFGILTALTNLATVVISILVIALFPFEKLTKKVVYLFIYLAILSTIVLPYYVSKLKEYNCFFCAPNKGLKTSQKINKIYPVSFFSTFNLNTFNKPYAGYDYVDRILKGGLWMTLHMTLFSDYWNYLVGQNYSVDTPCKLELIYTKPHYVDQNKEFKLKMLDYLGIPISLLFVITILCNIYKNFCLFFKKDNSYFIYLFYTIAIFIFLLQFIFYIFQYPVYINIHAGYLFPAIYIILISAVQNFENTAIKKIITIYIVGYSLFSFLTFFIL